MSLTLFIVHLKGYAFSHWRLLITEVVNLSKTNDFLNKQWYTCLLLMVFCCSVPSFMEICASDFSEVLDILSEGDVAERQDDADGNCLLGELQKFSVSEM